ncbi:MAG TPA: YkvA family protein, partial [Desulfobacteria bacterium]|nr:YkvA family protein [Desulfobacteria bacterium]
MIKVLLVLGLAYLVSPYDLFPDFFVGVGWLDDLVLLGLLWWYLYVHKKRRQYGYQREYSGADQHGARSSGEGSG